MDGMVLAEPIIIGQVVLLNKGFVLRKSLIMRLQSRDIHSIMIESEEEENISVVEQFNQSQLSLDEVFSDVLKNPIMHLIYEVTRDYLRK